MKVSSVAEMRRLDRRAIERFGIREEILMENAGGALYSVIFDEFGVKGKRFVVFCGLGNNGGDGFVVARKIHSYHGVVKVFILGDRKRFRGAARTNLDILSAFPIEVIDINSLETIRSDILHCDAIIDAIFGTGLTRNVEGFYAEVIETINASEKPVFSADIPSGVDGDSGKVMGTAVQADHTVTFGLPKTGNLLFPGYSLAGKLSVTHISFPPAVYETDDIKVEINTTIPLPPRKPDGHKGTFGDLLLIAGASSYYGAPLFAALSFMRAGGGYCRLAAPESMVPTLASRGSEIVFLPQRETFEGSVAGANVNDLLEWAQKVDMVVIGPGLSLNQETQGLIREMVMKVEKPILIDGDGITAISENLKGIKRRKSETVLTPHLGEMSRITHKSIEEIEADKIGILRKTCKELNAVIVLKGAHSLIGCPDEKVYINMSGNSGMATAGSGDVLAGTIAAMFGQGLTIQQATSKGVFIHGLAGDLAAEDKGEDGITAEDIMNYLPAALKWDRIGLSGQAENRYVLVPLK